MKNINSTKSFSLTRKGKTKEILASVSKVMAVFAVLATGGFSFYQATAVASPVTANSRFAWLLQGAPDGSVFNGETGPKVYDFDPDNTNAGNIANLKSQGITAICYFSAGTAEDWRADYSLFQAEDLLGPLPGWDGEEVVDTRSANVRSIMTNRIQHMKDMGCDGVEPDNIDAYTNISSPLNETTTLDYLEFLADAAHSRDLSIALKNGSDLVTGQLPGGSTVVDTFDFAVVEECYAYSECANYQPFADLNKAVFIVEYDTSPNCSDAGTRNFDAYKMSIDLDGTLREPCRTSGGVEPPADTTKPTVSITAPASSATLTGTTSITADASDNVGVSKVEFYQGATKLGEDTTAPYSYSWNTTSVPNGTYGITATAYDAASNSATSASVWAVVSNTVEPPKTDSFITENLYDTSKSVTVNLGGVCSTNVVKQTGITIPADIKSPIAGVGFTTDCASAGGSASVSIALGAQYDAAKLRVYKSQADGSIVDITGNVTITTQTVQGANVSVISYTAVDGGNYDSDGIVNGKIDDPVYVSFIAATGDTADAADADAAVLASTGQNLTYPIMGALAALGLSAAALRKLGRA